MLYTPMPKQLPSAEYLRECLAYDPQTGVLTWKARPLHHFKDTHAQAAWNGLHGGKTAGCNDKRYAFVNLDTVHYLAHRLIWALQAGEWPCQIDHINRNGLDNRWGNLREATHQQNKWNRSRPNTGLPRGVRRSRKGPRFTAQIKRDHRQIHLGSFDTPEEAHTAWLEAVREERGEFFRAD